jgi:hypothetical protein
MAPEALMPQGNSYQDLQDFRDMIVEGEDLFEESITIVRTTSQPATPGAMQGAPKPVTVQIPSTAVMVEMGVASKMFAVGVLSAGDVVIQIRERLQESNQNIGGSQVADKIIYAGNEYRMVSRPDCQPFGAGKSGDCPFYIVHLRRTNSTGDVVGE